MSRAPLPALALTALAALGLLAAVPAVLGARADQALVEVEGDVVEVDAKRERLLVRADSPNAPTHETRLRITYAWEWQGERYEGDRWAVDDAVQRITDEDAAAAREQALAPGAPIDVYVDADAPSQAVLHRRQAQVPMAVGTISAVGLLIGLGWLISAVRTRRYDEA